LTEEDLFTEIIEAQESLTYSARMLGKLVITYPGRIIAVD
jgi:hypothetical protein